jgi:2-hydroxychromene-2-carboxylate isomerase
MTAAKARMSLLDLHRWADHFGVPLRHPAGHPRRSVDAMRLLLGTTGELRENLTHALYQAYWREGRDIADHAVLEDAGTRVGLPAERTREVFGYPDLKERLRAATAEAVERGVFGVPAFWIEPEGTLLWGQDRLPMLEALLMDAAPLPVGERSAASPPELGFFHDFSSPYAYFAAERVEAVAARAGARVRWRPFFLGALFKALGLERAPIFDFAEAKRRYYWDDFARCADLYGLAYRRPSRFPMNTLTALRMVVAAADQGPLTRALYRAYWAEDRDLADPVELAAIADAQGFNGAALVARAGAPEVKTALTEATRAAEAAGCPGAPCFQVGDQMFWGHDRLLLVEKALGGWRPRVPDLT